jgi:hypothetical protein
MPSSLKSHLVACLLLATMMVSAPAAEYFVGLAGDDANDGRAPDAAFATIQKGVDSLESGDTLTIAPGHYREAVARENLGGEEAVTTIRARIPGTVLLRGDEPAPSFSKVPSTRFAYAASFPRRPLAVNEIDTRMIFSFQRVPPRRGVRATPGRNGRLDSDSVLVTAEQQGRSRW